MSGIGNMIVRLWKRIKCLLGCHQWETIYNPPDGLEVCKSCGKARIWG